MFCGVFQFNNLFFQKINLKGKRLEIGGNIFFRRTIFKPLTFI